ncbi:MAG: hypothetical protein ACRC2R_03240 [Xenococcaceae cyanobacterium]
MNPLSRFNDRAVDYAKYRPSYPTEAIDSFVFDLNIFSMFSNFLM